MFGYSGAEVMGSGINVIIPEYLRKPNVDLSCCIIKDPDGRITAALAIPSI